MLFKEHKDLFYVINSKTLKEFLPNKLKRIKLLKIGDLEKLCEMKCRKRYSQAKLLNIWFLLHNQKISKKGNRNFYKVSFPQTYVNSDNNIKKLIRNAAKQIGYLQDFARICGLSRNAIYSWLQGYRRIPLIAILKAAQINDIDAWKFLDGYKIYSITATRNEYFIHNFNISTALLELLLWVKTEGSNDISGASISIHQSVKKKDIIKTLSKRWKKHLKINPHIYKTGNKYIIKINSSPLRQIMVLRYNLPIGYKSKIIDFQTEINTTSTKEELKFILAILLETEGTIAFDKRFGYPRAQAKFYSSSLRAVNDTQKILKKLGYIKSSITSDNRGNYSITIASSINSILKLAEDIFPYLFNRNFKKLLAAIKNPILNNSRTPIARYARRKLSKETLKKTRTSTSDAPHIVKYGGFSCLK